MRILYVGHVGQSTGYGRAATDFVRALVRVGVDVVICPMNSTIVLPPDLEPLLHHNQALGLSGPSDTMVVHTLPLDCAEAAKRARVAFGTAKKTVAYTTWETFTAPSAVASSLSSFDEVWTPSHMSAQALRQTAEGAPLSNKVYVIPHCFDPSLEPYHRARHEGGERPGHPGASGRVRFYWIGQWNQRKNPQAVLRAFCHQFTREDDVELVMHSEGADLVQCYGALAMTNLPQSELPPIQITNHSMTDEQLVQMHRAGDIFVSASRGEAWNLPAFEAMLLGKIVIAPDLLGSDDFLGGADLHPEITGVSTNALKISSHAEIAQVSVRAIDAPNGQVGFVTTGAQGITARCLWNEPNTLELAQEMHHAAFNMVRRGVVGEVHYDPASLFGYDAVAKKIIERIS